MTSLKICPTLPLDSMRSMETPWKADRSTDSAIVSTQTAFDKRLHIWLHKTANSYAP